MDGNVELVKHLQNELHASRVRDPSFSMRALSKRIGVVPSALSDLIHGKRRITRKMALRILSALNVGPQEFERLLSLIDPPTRKKSTGSKSRPDQDREYTQLSLSKIHVVMDWYYFAIVSLAQTRDFREDPAWISKRLGIQQSVVRSALRKLEQVGLLVRDRGGQLTYFSSNFASPSDVPSYALRERHYQHLELASASLDNHSVYERDFSAMTIATTHEKMKEAKERIKCFRRELCAYLEAGEKEDVFLLNIQFFPLTAKEERVS